MTRVGIAEWALSLVMPADRAAATAGDLTETARGTLEFWSTLAQAVFGSALWQIGTKRARMAGAAGLTMAIATVYALVAQVVLLALAIVFGLFYAAILARESHSTGLGAVAGGIGLTLPILATWLWVAFHVGRIVARRYRSEEFAVWMTVALLSGAVAGLGWAVGGTDSLKLFAPLWFGLPPMLAGVIVERRKWLRQGALSA